MISRVAESCFWLSRYWDRVDTLAKLMDVNLAFVLDVDVPPDEHWLPLITVTGEAERFAELVGGAGEAEVVQEYLVWDERNQASIQSSVFWARENARTIRETISLEMWEAVNDLWLWLNDSAARKLYDRDRHSFFARVSQAAMSFDGVCFATMPHDEAFDFMRLGGSLEQAGQIARILDVKYHSLGPTRPGIESSVEAAQWLAILRSCSAVESFHKRSSRNFGGPTVAAFLMTDPSFPRSILHNVDRALNFLKRIRDGGPRGRRTSRAERILWDLSERLSVLNAEAIVRAGVHEVLTEIVGEIAAACDAVSELFFADAPVGASQSQTSMPTSAASTESFSRTLNVVHETTYNYKTPVMRSTHLLRLIPVGDLCQELLYSDVTLSVDGERSEFEDVFGNRAIYLELEEPYTSLIVRSEATVRVQTAAQTGPGDRHNELPLFWMPWQGQVLSPYLLPPELPESQIHALVDFAQGFVLRNDRNLMATLWDINQSIQRDFQYLPGTTNVETTPFEVLVSRRGVCQDFANLFICVARLLRIPARYRAGYLFTGADYSGPINAEASHAWVEVYLPYIGWVGYDPTNGELVRTNHVRVACGRNYRDASPMSGTIYDGGGDENMNVQVQVREIFEESVGTK